MRARTAAAGLLLVGLAVAALVNLLATDDHAAPTAADVGEPAAGGAPAARAVEAPAPLRAAPGAAGSQPGAEAAPATAPARDPATRARVEAMMDAVAEMRVALGAEKEADDTETREEERAREEAWSQLVDRITRAVSADPALALRLYEHTDDVDEALAIRLARILRAAEHPGLVAQLRTDALVGSTARRRRMAVAALEMRPAEVFLDPVAEAYGHDAEPVVRDEAAGVLARALLGRRYVADHVAIRTTLQAQLASPDAADRARAVRALMTDSRAGPDELARIRALADDPDAAVRREVARALRVMAPAVERRTSR